MNPDTKHGDTLSPYAPLNQNAYDQNQYQANNRISPLTSPTRRPPEVIRASSGNSSGYNHQMQQGSNNKIYTPQNNLQNTGYVPPEGVHLYLIRFSNSILILTKIF